MSMGFEVMSTGDRIREERKRLALTQLEFARKAGVHRNTQIKYEADERRPDTSYIEAMSKIGVDTNYVLTGLQHGMHNEIDDVAFICALESGLVIDHATLASIVDAALDEDTTTFDSNLLANELIRISPVLSEKFKQVHDIDAELLATVIESLEISMAKNSGSLSPTKKAHAAAMLYRTFKTIGKVDKKMIEEVFNLAAQSAA
jgi:transcriptional regulator with XRE-family HTH domain